MSRFRCRRFVLVPTLFSLLISPEPAAPAAPYLGEPPIAASPTNLTGLPRANRTKEATGGFTVSTSSRETVRSFYNTVYNASEDVPISATTDIANCAPGTTSQTFKEATLRRINWYRAMAGIPANVTLDPAVSAKDQQAALMMSRNVALSHTPPNTWFCWTAEGAEAAGKSNLAYGSNGPESISGYIEDYGTGNTAVGHRRWLLYPQTQVMGTGDVPEQGAFAEANAVWVMDAFIARFWDVQHVRQAIKKQKPRLALTRGGEPSTITN